MWESEYKKLKKDVESLIIDKQKDVNTLDAFMKTYIGKNKSVDEKCYSLDKCANSITSVIEKIVGVGYIIKCTVLLNEDELNKPNTVLREFFMRVLKHDQCNIVYRFQKAGYNFPRIWTNCHLRYFESTDDIMIAAQNLAKTKSIMHQRELSNAISNAVVVELDRRFLYYEPYIARVMDLEKRLAEIATECEQTFLYQNMLVDPVENSCYSLIETVIHRNENYTRLPKYDRYRYYYRGDGEKIFRTMQALMFASKRDFNYKWTKSLLEIVPATDLLSKLFADPKYANIDSMYGEDELCEWIENAVQIWLHLEPKNPMIKSANKM